MSLIESALKEHKVERNKFLNNILTKLASNEGRQRMRNLVKKSGGTQWDFMYEHNPDVLSFSWINLEHRINNIEGYENCVLKTSIRDNGKRIGVVTVIYDKNNKLS